MISDIIGNKKLGRTIFWILYRVHFSWISIIYWLF